MDLFSSIIESAIEDISAQSKQIDYLVIGSGTAGVTTAIELAHANQCVVMIEAGPFIAMEHIGSSPVRVRSELIQEMEKKVTHGVSWLTEQEYLSSSKHQPNNLVWSNVGGRTVFWCGLTPRFNPEEMSAWPFSYQEFEPDYVRAEQLMNVVPNQHNSTSFFSSPTQQQFIAQLNKAKLIASNAPVAVDNAEISNGHLSNGIDSSISRLLRSGLLTKDPAKGGISLLVETSATRLVAKGNKIDGVHVLDNRTGKTYTLAAKHVVLAGGAIQSTRLVLASELCDDNKMIGHYINDHLCIRGVIKLKTPPKTAPLCIRILSSEQFPCLFQLHGPFSDDRQRVLSFPTFWLDWEQGGAYLIFVVFGVGSVDYQNRVVLLDSFNQVNGLQNHAIIHRYNPEDFATLKMMEQASHKIAEVLGGEMISSETAIPGNPLHEYGGLRMGRDPATSVTDSYGRFWKYDNLSAADASIWPSQGAANSYLSITACSLRHARGLLL